jgi:hypothetical protein
MSGAKFVTRPCNSSDACGEKAAASMLVRGVEGIYCSAVPAGAASYIYVPAKPANEDDYRHQFAGQKVVVSQHIGPPRRMWPLVTPLWTYDAILDLQARVLLTVHRRALGN